MAKKWNLGAFFRSLTKQPEQSEQAEGPPEGGPAGQERPMPEVEPAPSMADLVCDRIEDVKGALLEVWSRWSGDYFPPKLSLTAGRPLGELGLDRQRLEQERSRLEAHLEQDAKKRLAEMERAIALGHSLDARCQIYQSRDKMLAWSFIFPPFGSDGTMHAEAVGRAMTESGVTTGIDSGAMVEVFQEPLYFKLLPIAVGTPAVEGTDGSIIEHFPRTVEKEVRLDENGVADYRAGSYVQLIEKDAVICDIVPPQPGTAGVRIDGTVIEPRTVRAAKIPSGTNTTVTDDGRQLRALRDGHLEFSHGAFQVRALLEIPGDVDYSTGNIDFPGDVHVCGDVRESFTVRATGMIAVDGIVEAATLEAGGDLVITRGVVGDNRAMLKSQGCVRVKYLESCVVYAGKSIYADCIMNSQIFSDDTINVISGRGSVIGGALTAANGIYASVIGAQSGRRTELVLGILPYVRSELQNIAEDLENIAHEQAQLEKDLRYLEKGQGLDGSSGKLAKARMRKSVLEIKERQLLKRREQLEPMESGLTGCWMKCDMMYPVTELTAGGEKWTVKQAKSNCKIHYDIKTGTLRELL